MRTGDHVRPALAAYPPTLRVLKSRTSSISFVNRREKARLKKVVEEIVLTQGNEFIKSLLRRKNLPIGTSKPAFLANLMSAIDDDLLTERDLDEWLREVEGWGNQHIYVYRLPAQLAKDALWADDRALHARMAAAGYADLWDGPASYAFPADLTLTGITNLRPGVRFEWHQGVERLDRVESMDIEQTIDGEEFVFKAYRRSRDRTVVRFEVRPTAGLAAAFVQVPISSDEHEPALTTMWEAVASVVAKDDLKPVNVGRAIRKIDDEQLTAATSDFRGHDVRLAVPGGWLALGADGAAIGYRDITELREARQRISTGAFTGSTSTLWFTPPDGKKDVQVRLYAKDRRIYVRAQLTEEQAWSLVRLTAKHA